MSNTSFNDTADFAQQITNDIVQAINKNIDLEVVVSQAYQKGLVEALLYASQHMIITWNGMNITNGIVRQVAVSQLETKSQFSLGIKGKQGTRKVTFITAQSYQQRQKKHKTGGGNKGTNNLVHSSNNHRNKQTDIEFASTAPSSPVKKIDYDRPSSNKKSIQNGIMDKRNSAVVSPSYHQSKKHTNNNQKRSKNGTLKLNNTLNRHKQQESNNTYSRHKQQESNSVKEIKHLSERIDVLNNFFETLIKQNFECKQQLKQKQTSMCAIQIESEKWRANVQKLTVEAKSQQIDHQQQMVQLKLIHQKEMDGLFLEMHARLGQQKQQFQQKMTQLKQTNQLIAKQYEYKLSNADSPKVYKSKSSRHLQARCSNRQ